MSEKIVQLNEEVIKGQIKELVRGSVEETLNELLVNNADLLLTAYDGQSGGTVMTCELVRRFGMPVILSAEAAGDWLNVQCTVC